VTKKTINTARQIKPVVPVQQGQSAASVTMAAPANIANNHNSLHLQLDARQVATAFAVVVAVLLALHVIVNSLRFTLGNEKLFGLVYMFSLGADGNIPTFYSSFALLCAGGLLLFIGYLVHKLQRTHWIYWLGLGGVFCFLAVDEMLELHERLIEPVRNVTGASGLLYYAWVIPYAVALLALGLLYLRFLLGLPRRTAVLFVASGAVFVTGAVGFEMLGGLFFQTFGSNTPGYVALQTLEEGMEMIGVVMFIYALVDYMERELGGLQISIERTTTGDRQ
jgi:hypothetical protein